MKYEVNITQTASEEIKDIACYLLSTFKSKQAYDNFYNELFYQLDIISEMPTLYGHSKIANVGSVSYRAVHVNNYIMLYTFDNQEVTVGHVFHELQDYGKYV